MKKQKGITLVSLIIIVVVLLILASVSVKFGTESMDVTRLKGFYLELETVQKRVDEIFVKNETYSVKNEDGTETVIEIKNAGADLTDEQKKDLQEEILQPEGIDLDPNSFRYFTIADIEKYLDITDINYNLFINFEERKIIAEQGINIAGVDYYVLKNDIYFVEQNTTKNEGKDGKIEKLKYSDPPIEYGEGRYKVNIKQAEPYIGDLDGTGYIKYKKDTSTYWNITNENYIIMEFDTAYDIIYIDLNNNSIEKTIKIEYKKDEDGNLVKDEEGNNILTVTEDAVEESEEI